MALAISFNTSVRREKLARKEKAESESYHKFIDEQAKLAYEELVKNQSPKKAFLGAILGVFLGLALLILFVWNGLVFYWMLFVPAAVIGYLACKFGKIYESKYANMIGVIGLLTNGFAVMTLYNYEAIALSTIPIAFIVTRYFAKLKLTEAQERAIWRKEIGKL